MAMGFGFLSANGDVDVGMESKMKVLFFYLLCLIHICHVTGCNVATTREKEVRELLSEHEIPISQICITPQETVLLFLADGYYNCSKLIGQIEDIEAFSGWCEYFDLKDVSECKCLEYIDAHSGLLLNIEQVLSMQQLRCLSGCLLTPPKDEKVQEKVNDLAGTIELIATNDNIADLCKIKNQRRYTILLTEKSYASLTPENLQRLKDSGFLSINSSRADVFWQAPEFDSNLWERKDATKILSDIECDSKGVMGESIWR